MTQVVPACCWTCSNWFVLARPGDAAPLNPSAISEEDSGSDEASTESIPALPQASKDKKEKPEQKTPRSKFPRGFVFASSFSHLPNQCLVSLLFEFHSFL